MTVVIDTNIILDYLLERENFAEIAKECIKHLADNDVKTYLTASTITDIHYFVAKFAKNTDVAKNIISNLLNSFYISSVNKTDCVNALKLNIEDYEDSLLCICAKKIKADYIITRNIKHFINSPVKSVTPGDFIKQLN